MSFVAMADPALILLILIGASAGERPHGATMSAAISDALGRDARVLVEERDSDPTDAEAASLADAMRGSVVAEVSWTDERHAQAHVHVYLALDRSWYDRDIAFEPADALDERERAIGFMVGAMIRATESSVLAVPARPVVVASEPSRPASLTPPPVVPPPREEPSRFAVDVAGMIMTGIAGVSGGLGPSLRAHVAINDAFSVHVGGALAFGSIPDAGARMATTRLIGGGRWRWLTVARDLSFDVGLDALVVHHAVRRSSPVASRDRWMMGAHTDVGVGWRATTALEPFVTMGVDGVLGTTPITVAGARTAEIPPFRAVGELGLKVHF
jgi:hypothetical protein